MQYVFLNTIVIPLVYTEKIFSSVYLQTCFTVDNVISKSYMSSYYLAFFSFIIFPLKFPWYILREFFCWYLPDEYIDKKLYWQRLSQYTKKK
jgi:hypothetical protein